MIKTYDGKHENLACRIIENECLRLAVAPQLGGKITSLYYKPQAFEVLFQPTDRNYRLPEYGAAFAAYDTSGADEMFPTIDACAYPGNDAVRLPDHGELWSIPWSLETSVDCISTTVRGRCLPYSFRRKISLKERCVRLEYELENESDEKLYGLWAFHALVACDEASRIILPQTKRVLNVHDSHILGVAKTSHEFPLTQDLQGKPYRLDWLAARESGKTEKWYVDEPLGAEGPALLLNQGRLNYKLSFDAKQLPYLGVWLNEGGFKGEYNCALEPSDGFYDSAELALANGCLPALSPRASRKWELGIELSDV